MSNKDSVILKIIFITSLVIIFLGCSSNKLIKEIDSYIATQDEYVKFNGSILIAKGEEILVNKGYGMANYEHNIYNDTDTKFRIGSLTKQFTAMAILILQEQGLLNVSDYINLYIPNCPDSWKEITIHQLLTHSSGIPNLTSFPEYSEIMIKKHTPLQTISLFINKPLKFKPGERFSYSNSGYIVLGFIIETISNIKYENFLYENIFKKIGMENTGYDHNKQVLKNRANGYINSGTINAQYIDMSVPHAAGALYSTVEDLYLWDRALYTEEIVKTESLKSMFTKHIGNSGYGWGIDTTYANSKRVQHSGGINGFSSYIRRYVDDDLVLIILSNDEKGLSILNGVSNIVNEYVQDGS